jgi:hypothetical protein
MTTAKMQHLNEVKLAKSKHKAMMKNKELAKKFQSETISIMAKYVPKMNCWLNITKI